jgi:hypothetical protein
MIVNYYEFNIGRGKMSVNLSGVFTRQQYTPISERVSYRAWMIDDLKLEDAYPFQLCTVQICYGQNISVSPSRWLSLECVLTL